MKKHNTHTHPFEDTNFKPIEIFKVAVTFETGLISF